MAILRSEIRNKFTNIPNSVIQDNLLSDGDFRLLIYLYSLPDKWKINQGYLGQQLNCSRININKKLRRIKDAGYLEIIKANIDKVDADYIYVLKERDVSPRDVSPRDVSPRDVSVNDTHINTNIINTELINTNIKSREHSTKTFIPPTPEEIHQYCLERNNFVNWQQFYDFYESKGWMVGKNKMKDWKACVRTWEQRDKSAKKQESVPNWFNQEIKERELTAEEQKVYDEIYERIK